MTASIMADLVFVEAPDDVSYQDAHEWEDINVGIATTLPAPATAAARPTESSLVRESVGSASSSHQTNVTHFRSALLADPLLAFAADAVDDLQDLRQRTANRLNYATRAGADKDGVERGLGLCGEHPQVAVLLGVLDGVNNLEHQAILNLQRLMRRHPLGEWTKAQQGIGTKQAARLLASIGDPYWNTARDRPRTVSELWAYCGMHVLPASHAAPGTQTIPAGGEAPKHRKGQRSNWNSTARMRVYLIANNTIKYTGKVEASRRVKARSPYRDVYDQRRVRTDLTHPDWTDGHHHNDALRITAKAILRDLWIEARAIHADQ